MIYFEFLFSVLCISQRYSYLLIESINLYILSMHQEADNGDGYDGDNGNKDMMMMLMVSQILMLIIFDFMIHK